MIITFGLVDVEDESENIIDKSKVTDERQKSKRQYVDSNNNSKIVSIYFDGRKDRTAVMEGLKRKKAKKRSSGVTSDCAGRTSKQTFRPLCTIK